MPGTTAATSGPLTWGAGTASVRSASSPRRGPSGTAPSAEQGHPIHMPTLHCCGSWMLWTALAKHQQHQVRSVCSVCPTVQGAAAELEVRYATSYSSFAYVDCPACLRISMHARGVSAPPMPIHITCMGTAAATTTAAAACLCRCRWQQQEAAAATTAAAAAAPVPAAHTSIRPRRHLPNARQGC